MMMQCATRMSAVAVAILVLCQAANALAVRLDAGDWDTVFVGNSTTTSNVGFTLNFQVSAGGITGDQVNVNSAGSLRLFDGASANYIDLNPYFDAAQTSSGNTTQFFLEETNAAFSAPGIDAGFRATWSAQDVGGALLNQFQVGLFGLSNGQTALEFNYDILSVGSAATDLGYVSSLGATFDLLSALGLIIGDAFGEGDLDPTFPDLCLATLSALACNNYYNGSFGPSDLLLPDIAGGFFRNFSGADPTPVQGRYLFLFGDGVGVSEPSGLGLIGAGALLLGIARRRRRNIN